MPEYEQWKQNIRAELEAWEGHGPPSDDELWSHAAYKARGAAEWIDDMPNTPEATKTAKGDVLEALVAIELMENYLQEGSDDS